MSARGSNFIRNSNFQLTTQADIGYYTRATTAMKPDGTALQDAVTITGFTPSSNQPTVYTNDTRQLQNGSLIFFDDGHDGLSGWCHRVYDLVPGVSFALQLPFDTLTPAASVSLVAKAAGGSSTQNKINGPDAGWRKSQPETVWWIDDFVINRCLGSKRVLGLRKALSAPESLMWTADYAALLALRGRQATYGALVRQKVGAGGVTLMIDDGVTQSFSTPATGASFVDAQNNHYQFLSVDHLFDPNATKVSAGLKFAGAIGDICYLGGPPTLKYGTGITPDDLEQPQRELIDADTHHNLPAFNPMQRAMPGVQCVPGSGLYAYCNLDFEALGFGLCSRTVSKINCKIELFSSQPDLCLFVAALDPTGATSLVFGPQQFTPIASRFNATSAPIPLRPSNGYEGNRVGVPNMFSIFSNYGGVPIVCTLDLDDVWA